MKHIINLNLPPDFHKTEEWRERLYRFSFPFHIHTDPRIREPKLHFGQQRFCGQEAVERFLIDFESTVQDWRACTCDLDF